MKIDLREQCFENIRIKNTSLIGANLVRSDLSGSLVRIDLSGSKFDNVIISGMNLNQAKLVNCKWRNLRINEKIKLNGHSVRVNQVFFAPDGISLASCSSHDTSIRLWDVKTRQINSIIRGKKEVKSICFSPKNTTLTFSSGRLVYLWNLKTGKQISKLDSHSSTVTSVNFSPDSTTLASSSYDKSIRLWDVKTRQQKVKLDGEIDIYFTLLLSFHLYYFFRISQTQYLEAQGALILKGEFFSFSGVDLRQLFKSKGGLILDLLKYQKPQK